MNKIYLLGRLTRDPEIRTTQSGKIVTTFTLAVDRQGGGKDNVDFLNVVAWERLGEICGNNLAKGQRAMVEGRVQNRSYDGKDGKKRWITEVILQTVEFIDRKSTTKKEPDLAGQFGQDVGPDEEIPF